MVIMGAPNLPVWNYDRGINYQPYSILTFDELNSTVISMTQANEGSRVLAEVGSFPPLKVEACYFFYFFYFFVLTG